MITAVIRWCLSNTFLVFIGVAVIVFGGIYAVKNTPVDAIPDIGEKQVIVFTDWPGRSPQDVDNQVTYPLTTSLTGTPGVKTIRSMSGFGFSMVFVIFKDDVDYYWARSRVLERINVAQQRLPTGVTPVLGPDATALGQVYWYTVEGEGFDLAALLGGRTGHPVLRDRDTLYVEPTVLLELARDGSLAVDGEPCTDADLPPRLRDRFEAGVRSATLHAHRDTPHDRIQPLFDACIAAGIPSERLKLDSAAVPD